MTETPRPALERLLRPRSIAVVGASERSFYSANTTGNLIEHGFSGTIFPINPVRDQVLGLQAYPSVADLPSAPDNVVMLVRPEVVLASTAEAIDQGAGGITVMAAGFAEARTEEGRRIQDELTRLVRDAGMPMIGPNCLGYLNAGDRIALWSAPMRARLSPGPIAVVSQSGGSSGALYKSLLDRELGVGWFVTAGNQAVLEVADYLEFLVEDPEIGILACFIEGIRDGQKFLRVADRGRELGKPVVVLKTGRSERGRKAALAHTGSMAGSDAVYDAVFRRHGIIRVGDFEEFVETLALLNSSRHWPHPIGAPAVLSVSGGACALFADKAEDHGLSLAVLSAETAATLAAVLPPSGNAANPIDCTGQALQELDIYESVLAALAEDRGVGSVVHCLSSGIPDENQRAHRAVLDLILSRARGQSKMPILCSLNKQSLSVEQREFLRANPQLGYVEGLGAGLKAIANVAKFGRGATTDPARRSDVRALGRYDEADPATSALAVDEQTSLSRLDDVGIPTVARRFARTPEECRQVAEGMGTPLVLKIVARGVSHKTQVGGVALDLTCPDDVVAEAHRMAARISTIQPTAEIVGFLVQAQAEPGLEIIVGATVDPQFGAVLVVGAGGVHAELIADRVLIPTPATRTEVLDALPDLRIFRLLDGEGRSARADVDALVSAVLGVQELVLRKAPTIMQVDVNPLLVYDEGSGVLAVDALIVRQSGTVNP